MASYHFSAQIIGRKAGRSAVAAAAYRAGERLHDRRVDQTFDFSKRRGVTERMILLPEGAAPWLADRAQLWNHVEGMEKRKDAQLVREINLALPHELSHDARVMLVRNFVREQFVSVGMVADIAWHEPIPEKGDDPRNFHAHIMLTLRQAGPHGLRAVKTREWNSDELMNIWRRAWSEHQNRALEEARLPQRVDHRSLHDQRADAQARGDRATAERLDRVAEIHIGPKGRAAERRTDRSPASRTRTKATARPVGGTWRSAKVGSKRARNIDYPRIDRGSRSGFALALIDRNIRQSLGRADRLERLASRLRAREARAARVLTVANLPLNQQLRYGLSLSPTRILMARRHRSRISLLLHDIERLLANLMQARDLLGDRQRSFVQMRGMSTRRSDGRTREI